LHSGFDEWKGENAKRLRKVESEVGFASAANFTSLAGESGKPSAFEHGPKTTSRDSAGVLATSEVSQGCHFDLKHPTAWKMPLGRALERWEAATFSPTTPAQLIL
jgi:hypothetical protein